MKGKTTIILTNVETGEQEVHENENLITNALDKIIGINVAMNFALNSYILPIASKALGGIMLFDNTLTEDVDNIHFPVEAHLVGYAGQDVNSADTHRGSFNALESGLIENGFVSVWDFGTSQANGTIKSVARTSYHSGICPVFNFNAPDYGNTNNGALISDASGWYPIRYDGEYVYLMKANTSTHTMRLARTRVPMIRMGAGDYSNVARQYEIVASWDTFLTDYTYYSNQADKDASRNPKTATVYADDVWLYEDGRDGYIYCLGYSATNSYNTYQYDITYFTIKYGDESYEKSDTIRLTSGIGKYMYSYNSFYWARKWYGHVYDGILYILSGDRKIIYKVPLNSVGAYNAVRIIESDNPDYITRLEKVMSRNGATYFEVYHYTATGFNRLNGVLYPDRTFLLVEYSYQGSSQQSHNNDYKYDQYFYTCDDDLTVFGYGVASGQDPSSNALSRMWVSNYLGTINNLGTTITKTVAQTMKIIYTLTDIDEEEEET